MTINFRYVLCLIIMPVLAHHTVMAQKEFKQDTSLSSVTNNSRITYRNNNLEVEDGECIVFNIQLSNGGDQRVDAGMDKGLIFELPGDKDSFEISQWDQPDEAFIQISGCRCLNIGYNPVSSGMINGNKLPDGSWQIRAHVTAEGHQNQQPIEFLFEGVVRGAFEN